MKRFFSLFVLFPVISLSSCIEIVEEITFYNDHSGNIKYRLETNRIGNLLGNLLNLTDRSFEDQIKNKTREFADKIKTCKGIDNVKYHWGLNQTGNILEFNFSNTYDLNNAIYKLIEAKQTVFTPKYIKYNNHNFRRKNFAPWVNRYLEAEKIAIPSEYLMDLVSYKTIIHFPAEVKRYNGRNLKLTDNRKGLIQTNDFMEVLNDKTNISIRSTQKH